MQNKINFFGYGANRGGQRLRDIFGRSMVCKGGAILENYILAYQVLKQIPEEPRKILKTVWGDSFRCYTMKPGKGLIAGVIWELSEADLGILKKWEFVGEWREIIPVSVKTYDEKIVNAFTDRSFDNSPITAIVDGLDYENNLNCERPILDTDEYKIKEIIKIRKQIETIRKDSINSSTSKL